MEIVLLLLNDLDFDFLSMSNKTVQARMIKLRFTVLIFFANDKEDLSSFENEFHHEFVLLSTKLILPCSTHAQNFLKRFFIT